MYSMCIFYEYYMYIHLCFVDCAKKPFFRMKRNLKN